MAQEVKPIQATVIDSAKLQKAINKIKKQKADDKAAEKKRSCFGRCVVQG